MVAMGSLTVTSSNSNGRVWWWYRCIIVGLFGYACSYRLPPVMKDPYCINVKLSIKPERRDEFLKCIHQNQVGTLTNEKNALRYAWGESTHEPNTFYFSESFRGKEGFLEHVETPHFKNWEGFASTEPFTAEPEVSKYNLLGLFGKPLGFKRAGWSLLRKTQKNEPIDEYCLNVKMSIKPERRKEFMQNIYQNQIGTLCNEKNALRYCWGESCDEPNTFYFHEAFRGKEGFIEHTQMPHFKKWEEFASTSPFRTEPQVSFYTLEGMNEKPLSLQRGVWSAERRAQAISRGVADGAFQLFLFFEQFDPNPVTKEGKAMRAEKNRLQQQEMEKRNAEKAAKSS